MHLTVIGDGDKSIQFLDVMGEAVDPWTVLVALADKSHSVRVEVESTALCVEVPPGEARDQLERVTGRRHVGSKVVAIRAYVEPKEAP